MEAYGGDGLHAENEGVRGQVARVGEGVLLPELSKEILFRAHQGVVDGEVACDCQLSSSYLVYMVKSFRTFKEEVNASSCNR